MSKSPIREKIRNSQIGGAERIIGQSVEMVGGNGSDRIKGLWDRAHKSNSKYHIEHMESKK